MVSFNNKIKRRKKKNTEIERDIEWEREKEIVSRGKFYRKFVKVLGFLKSYSFVIVALYNNYTQAQIVHGPS